MQVYKAISEVAGALAAEGIGKDKRNQQQGFAYRGIDDVMNHLSGLLHKHGLVILPRYSERVCVERTNSKGTALFYVTVRGDFDLVSVDDGSKHTITAYGEAMDSGDKATNKAMSIAYKYAALQAFCVPTEAQDPDAEVHSVAPSSSAPKPYPAGAIAQMRSAKTIEELKSVFGAAWMAYAGDKENQDKLQAAYNEVKSAIESGD